MKYDIFISTLNQNTSPPNISKTLEAMWLRLKDDWSAAHDIVQDINTKEAAWIHAHLHRIEGDLSNAKYWYNRAEQDTSHLSIDDEAKEIIFSLIS